MKYLTLLPLTQTHTYSRFFEDIIINPVKKYEFLAWLHYYWLKSPYSIKIEIWADILIYKWDPIDFLNCQLYHIYSQWWEHSMLLANLLRLQVLDRNKKINSYFKFSYHISMMGLQHPKQVQHVTLSLMCFYVYISMYTYTHLHKTCVVDLTLSLMLVLRHSLSPPVQMPILKP